ncbi:isoprenylcysteine carboxylmethyltransferase family protein [Alphaproteobacteria bacterium]|nr:isoprenylcysteine carboxylmethyltransferase family protein [Alphaproteobacteria bacterium]MDA8624690.1 isoprenylcysteine carboxylmethyltransferase family protein [Alphaproteobacteria bacterium]MDA8642821.1 isoprenylcysteine carboxylmethyltransferase family protein [Alphaproteobacteria bacterium]MDA8666183.1 isoprenylcysteine carboxylmethyltransferase family protein [Alphaproteobacteria bacterium]MDB2381381.1 isoprenylcysteine carboxylmethyltransferase family protein [Alphaproteobacteria bact
MKIYPPLMVLFGILAQLLIGYVAPVRPILNETWQYIGVGLMLFGFTLIFLVARSFRTNETTIIPDGRPSTLMENGLFAYSRNPIYLSMTIFLLGSALAVGQIWALAIVPVFVLLVRQIWIVKEEESLEAEFGQIYRNYKMRVRRWL